MTIHGNSKEIYIYFYFNRLWPGRTGLARYMGQADVRWDLVFLRRIANQLRSKSIMFLLIVLSNEVYRLRLGLKSEWYWVYHSFRGVVNDWGRMNFFIYNGDGISEWYEIIICSGKSWVYIWWPIVVTFSSHSSIIGVFFLVTYGVCGIFEWCHSFRESRE